MERNFTESSFIARIRQLFTGRCSREERPSKEERQAVREIRHSIASDAAAGATSYAILLLMGEYVRKHGNPNVQAEYVGRMAQYERGEISSMEVVAQLSSMIAVYANEEMERQAPPLPPAPRW